MGTKRLSSRVALLRTSALAAAACAAFFTPVSVALAIPQSSQAIKAGFIGLFPESVWTAFTNILPFITLALLVWAILATMIARSTLEKVRELEYEIEHLHKMQRNMARRTAVYPQAPIGQRGVRPMTQEFSRVGGMTQAGRPATQAQQVVAQQSAQPTGKHSMHSVPAAEPSTGKMRPVASSWLPTDGGVNWNRMVDEIEDELGVNEQHRTVKRERPSTPDIRAEIPALYKERSDDSIYAKSAVESAVRAGKVVDFTAAHEALSNTASFRPVGRHSATASFVPVAPVMDEPIEGEAFLPAVAGQEPGWHRAPVNPASVIDQMLAELEG